MTASLPVLRNFVGGAYVDTRATRPRRWSTRRTGEAYARAAGLDGRATWTPRCMAAAGAFETWRDTTPARAQRALLRLADAVEARADEIIARRVPQHRQAGRA